jgi:hypothetical protein
MSALEIVPSSETGKLNLKHLKRYWNKSLLKRDGKLANDSFPEEWKIDTTLLTVAGLGLEQTVLYVYREAPTFDEFEDWILEVSGIPDIEKVNQFNRLFEDKNVACPAPVKREFLTDEDWVFWNQNGYLIIRNAVSKKHCDEAIQAICEFIKIDRYDENTWYDIHAERQGIMVQLFQHAALEQNRKSPQIKKAFEEIWNRADLWMNTDRAGFNPPQTSTFKFTGPFLHWDVSIHPPVRFGTQGILYLADTAANQGAFTLVPGFHHILEEWLNNLTPGTDPRSEDLYALGAKPIAANAGDFIIWHHALPHGSSPNTAELPRFVQYINYAPFDEKESEIWL